MNRHIQKVAALAAGTLFWSGHAAVAANHVVLVGGNNNAFAPAQTFVMVGDMVTFTNAGGEHNVASMPGAPLTFRCSEDCESNSGVSGALWSSTITIPPAAAHQTIGFYCERHGFSMSGTLTTTNPVSLQTFQVE
jgi:plastocyanin